MDFWTFAQQLFNGLSVGSIYMLIGVGITLVFGLTGIVNFAHGEVMMVGAYTVLAVAPQGGAGFALGLVAAIVVVSALSYGMERGLFRFTLQRPVNGFLISLGMILILQNALVARWGATQQNVGAAFGTVWQLGELRVSADRLLIIGVTAVSFVLLHHLLVRTRVGTAVRAAAMDRETAGLMAVPVPRIITLTFITGGVLAAIAGSLLASIYPIMPSLGSAFVVKGFAVALVGGLGNIKGAMLAALVIGIAEAMLAGLGYGGWTDAVSFALMIAILLFRPQGLLRGTDGSY